MISRLFGLIPLLMGIYYHHYRAGMHKSAPQEEPVLPLFSGFARDLSVRETAQGKTHCRRQYEEYA
jgi:hypothetical protein